MFGFFQKDTAQLQLYGKLPIAKDYLRIGYGEGVARSLREWLDRAFSGVADAASPSVLPYPMRFLTAGEEGPPLMGSIWPSSDAGGLRLFPFAVAVERKARSLLTDLEEGLGRAEGLWPKIEAIHAAHGNFGDGRSFLAAMRGQMLDAHKAPALPRERVDLETWTGALWPDRGGEGLDDTLDRLGELRGSRRGTPLRLPLVAGLSLTAQVHGWWRVMSALDLVDSGSVPTLFFPQPLAPLEEPLFLTVFRGPLRVEDLPWLCSAREETLEEPGDLCDSLPRRIVDAVPAPEKIALLADSLAGAIAGFKGRSGRL
jgi:hypothetical protein